MKKHTFKIYMDVCCYNRPFDDQSQDRIQIESNAVLLILNHCQSGEWLLYGSDAIKYEIANIKDEIKRQKVEKLFLIASEHIVSEKSINARAKELNSIGLGALDSLHLAYSEYASVDVFLTTDDALVNKSKAVSILKVKVINPVQWILEVE